MRQVEPAQRAQAVQAGHLAQAVGRQVQHLQAAQPGQALDRCERGGRQVELDQLVRLRKRRCTVCLCTGGEWMLSQAVALFCACPQFDSLPAHASALLWRSS